MGVPGRGGPAPGSSIRTTATPRAALQWAGLHARTEESHGARSLDRSILQRVLLTVGLGLAAACATASLSRPVAELVPGAPEEFRWLSFRWPDGAVLSYVIETSIETAVAERVKTTRERHRFRMSSMGSVVSGVRRVRIAFDDVDIADAP